jgi:hypothetical protein
MYSNYLNRRKNQSQTNSIFRPNGSGCIDTFNCEHSNNKSQIFVEDSNVQFILNRNVHCDSYTGICEYSGTTGPIGATGPTGLPGYATRTGATGPSGPTGVKGLDGIAQALGIDEKGLIFRTVSEMITNETTKGTFSKTLEQFYLEIFGGIEPTSVEQFKKDLSSQEKTQIMSSLEQTAKSQGTDLKDPDAKQGMFDAFFGNLATASNANAAQSSTTSGDLFANLTGK